MATIDLWQLSICILYPGRVNTFTSIQLIVDVADVAVVAVCRGPPRDFWVFANDDMRLAWGPDCCMLCAVCEIQRPVLQFTVQLSTRRTFAASDTHKQQNEIKTTAERKGKAPLFM